MFANVQGAAEQVMELAGGNRNSYSLGCKMTNDRIGIRRLSFLLVAAVFFFSPASRAQTNTEQTPGINSGNYNIQESIEVGYRQDWIHGNLDTYDTFVNLNSGIRLLDYTASMRSIDHQGILFDNLNFSNFGYGGDPDNVSRLRIDKNKWYDFSVVFRRHQNFWDYNLLANPLNPVPIGTTQPAFPATQSPHSLDLVRRMQDYDLMLLPQSRVRFRLGYSHDVNEGPALTSFHGTTEFLLAQNFRMTTNAYRAGMDLQVLPKTTISYDQFLEYDKQDNSDSLANTPFLVSTSQYPGTVPVDLGLDWYYPPAGTTAPCAAPLLSTGFASPTCKEYQSFSRSAPTRNFMPTERLSFQSTYIPRLEMSGSTSYSSSNNVVSNNFYSANEWTASGTSLVRDAIVEGPATAKQIFVHANWSGIYSLTEKVRILDSVRFDDWRNPGVFIQVSPSLFATAVQVTGQTGILLPIAQFAPLVDGGPTFDSICPAPYTALTCPQHGASSSADNATAIYSQFLGQRLLSNTIQIEADLTQRISARIGYMYENRKIGESAATQTLSDTYYPGGTGGTAANDFFAARGNCKYSAETTTFAPAAGGDCTQNADGSVTWAASADTIGAAIDVPRTISTINEQVGLAGLTWRPMDTLRINADFQFGYNDYSYTRIWPRQIQSYKVHVNYRPRTWATIDGAIDIHENRDNIAEVDNLEHGRTYSFDVVLAPNSKFEYTLGYNYTDLNLQTFICFRDTFGTLTGVGLPVFSACPFNGGVSTINLGATAFYTDKQHYVYSDVMWTPIKRVTATLGYSGTFAGGSTLFLNPLQPAGTLTFNYQKPFVSLRIDIYKGLSYKTTWDYYGYNSKSPTNISVPITGGTYALQPIAAADFNGSTLMFALRYAF
jgi:hypothetical protein